MKVSVVFACVLAVATASPSYWTLRDLSDAIENPSTDPVLRSTLEGALNIVMDKLFAGEKVDHVTIRTEAGVACKYSLAELDSAIYSSGYVMKPYLEDALNEYMNILGSGQYLATIDVYLPTLELSHWTLADLDALLSDESTSPALVPYLEHALNELMHALFAGESLTAAVIALPLEVASLVPTTAPVALPSPVAEVSPSEEAPFPVAIASPPTEVALPSPVPAAVAPVSSPLVEIVLNVNNPNVVDISPVPAFDAPHPGPIVVRPTPDPAFNPIDLLAPLPVEELQPSPVGIVGPMV